MSESKYLTNNRSQKSGMINRRNIKNLISNISNSKFKQWNSIPLGNLYFEPISSKVSPLLPNWIRQSTSQQQKLFHFCSFKYVALFTFTESQYASPIRVYFSDYVQPIDWTKFKKYSQWNNIILFQKTYCVTLFSSLVIFCSEINGWHFAILSLAWTLLLSKEIA